MTMIKNHKSILKFECPLLQIQKMNSWKNKITISVLSWQKSDFSAWYLLHKQFLQVSWSIFTDDGLYNSGLSILAPELSAQKIYRPLNWATWVKAGRVGGPTWPSTDILRSVVWEIYSLMFVQEYRNEKEKWNIFKYNFPLFEIQVKCSKFRILNQRNSIFYICDKILRGGTKI